MKELVKRMLEKIGLYYKIKFSFVYDIYWGLINSEIIAAREKEVEFYREVMNGMAKGGLIFDVGANIGNKSAIFLRLGAKVIAVEPDETSFDILQKRFRGDRITVLREALSDREGMEEMFIDRPGSFKNTLSKKWTDVLGNRNLTRFKEVVCFTSSAMVQTKTLDKLIEQYGLPFFVKIDVEGYELNVLRGLSRRIRNISFELNMPEFKNEGKECIRLLKRIYHAARFNYVNDVEYAFKLDSWLEGEEFLDYMEKFNDRYMEVFCRM